MKIDTRAQIYEFDGKPAKTKSGHQLTLGRIMAMAFNLSGQGVPDDLKPAERGLLAMQCFRAEGELDLTTEEIAAVKKLIALMYPPITVAQAHALLEGKENPFAN